MSSNYSQMSVYDCWHAVKTEIAESRNWKYTTKGGEKKYNIMARYDRAMEAMISVVENVIMGSATLEDYHIALEAAKKATRPNGKAYSQATLTDCHSVMADLFRWAVRQKPAVAKNIFAAEVLKGLPKKIIEQFSKKRINKISDEEIIQARKRLPRILPIVFVEKLCKEIIKNLLLDGRFLGLALSLYTGARPGERRAFRFCDIKPYKSRNGVMFFLCVRTSLDESGTDREGVKTINGYRYIPIHPELLVLIGRRWRCVQKLAKEKGINDPAQLPMCCYMNDIEKPCNEYMFTKLAQRLFTELLDDHSVLLGFAFDQLAEEHDLVEDPIGEMHFTCYVFRRNFCSWLLAADVDADNMKVVVGHDLGELSNARKKYLRSMVNLASVGMKIKDYTISYELHRELTTIDVSNINQFELENATMVHISNVEKKTGMAYFEIDCKDPGAEVHLDGISLDELENISITEFAAPSEYKEPYNSNGERYLALRKLNSK